MRCHFLKSLFYHRCRDFRPPLVVLRFRQCPIEIPRHHKCGALGPLLERRDDNIYRLGVIRGEIISYDVPPPRSRCQLEANNVGAKLTHSLHRKMW